MHSSRIRAVPATDDPAFDDFEFSLDPLPRCPDGLYEVCCVTCQKTTKFLRSVLYLEFKITTQGAAFGLILPTYINLPVRKGGLLTRSKLARWLRVIQAFDPTVNPKSAKPTIFRRYLFVAEVVTVTVDRLQRPLHEVDKYSKINELTDVVGKLG